MKQDKNFTVRLKATIERKLKEAGIFDKILSAPINFEEYTKTVDRFFTSLEDIKLSDLNKFS
jgi:hypothetical protein